MKKLIKKVSGILFALAAVSSVAAQARKVDVWDFGGVAEKDATNHISLADIDNLAELGNDGKFTAADIVFGDLTLKTNANDRAFNQGKKNYGDQSYTVSTFKDGYVSDGCVYFNGKGGEATRYMLLRNVKAGDVITFYARISNSGDEKIHFASVDASGAKDGKQDEVALLPPESTCYSYIATTSGTYKVHSEANSGKPVYFRIKRTSGVEVSGSLASLPAGKPALKFVVQETKQEIQAKINGKSYSVGLPAGYNFTAVLSGVKGYGISSSSKLVSIDAKAPASLKKDLSVVEQKTYVASGKVNGIDSAYKVQGNPSLIFNPPADSTYLPVEAKITGSAGKFEFRGELEPSVIYTASLSGLNDYDLTGDLTFEGSSAFTKDLSVVAKKIYDVSGKFFGETSVLPSKISFKNVDDGFVYDGTVSGNSYSAKLRDGAYEVVCSTEKAASTNHIVVSGKKVEKDIKLNSKNPVSEKLALKKDIYVGGDKADYKTVKEAIAAAASMAPSSEAERITIHIAPGVYRSQLIINTPYITLKNDTPSKEVKLTWYYGIGYNYYSADANGYWDENLAYDKFTKRGVAKWGVATYVQNGAKAFRAEGIVFETSFNKYVTDEEIADGVEPDGSLPFVRKINSDVRSKAGTERSSAICIEADESEFYNCRFIGSQDTLYTAGIKNFYFRNCYIEGNTDFIFGDGTAVFENCEISFCGYTDLKACGYLTAARTVAPSKGYLFYNCVVSADNSVHQMPGYFGRPWGPAAGVAWVNTIFGNENIIAPDGWCEMSGNRADKAFFREINSKWNEKAPDLSSRIKGTVVQNSSEYTPKAYFGEWKPVYYTEPSEEVLKLKKASFTTDDDINTPYPGHTITVHYTLGKADSEDMSLIQWYSTKGGKTTLVKQSAGYADKTYLIQKSDSGAKISCVVTPMLRDGKAYKAVTAKLDATVKEGYAVPAKSASVRSRTADAVNVFLASDSTCKDYSAAGMWSAGKTRNEGAWGEFLQCWFNGGVAIQNYANGGRSSRNFMNEGSLDAIAKNIAKGDYLFIQFGHNDCSNGAGYLEDRYVPLGTPDKKGIYPVTAGKKVPTPASYASKYGPEFYSYDCGATYKWYLKQYVEVAKKAGAIPVLVTPVSRLYFGSDGKIAPHHDSKDTSTKTQTTKNNAYVEAVRQLAKEENVILIDGYEITKALYEKAWADKKNRMEAEALMNEGESTHNNKLGGFIVAGEFAKAIKAKIPVLGKSLVHPVKAIGENSDGSLMFTVDSNGKFSCNDAYWTDYEQKVMDSFGK